MTMTKDWILLAKESRRRFKDATWVPLRALDTRSNGQDAKGIGFVEDVFALGSVALPRKQEDLGEELRWDEIGTGHDVRPYVHENGLYSPVDQFVSRDGKLTGVELILEHPQPTIDARRWVIAPDLYIALRLIKEGNTWLRPEEGFEAVIREHVDAHGDHTLIEIKRPFLLDYLAARDLSLRMAFYRQRVENVATLQDTAYEGLEDRKESRDGGRFSLHVTPLDRVFGGSVLSVRTWRTDVDEDSDAPVMGPENSDNVDYETHSGMRGGFAGIRVEGEFWGEEWIRHDGKSTRIRGDNEEDLPDFIAETDGRRMRSGDLDNEDIGRWLWFKTTVMGDLLNRRGFSLKWCTRETGQLRTPSSHVIHFGVNAADLITVYAYDIARLPAWEQRIWYAHNTVPDGLVSKELLASQVRADPASTRAPETSFVELVSALEELFHRQFGLPLFGHPLSPIQVDEICRFKVSDEPSLLRLAKELVRAFTDRLSVKDLRKVAIGEKNADLKSMKLLERIVADRTSESAAHEIFQVVVGVYDLRTADAHPTSSSIAEAYLLAGIDRARSPLRQAEQMIDNYSRAIHAIGRALLSSEPGVSRGERR
jgi:hypothetical protein